jgi:ribosomal protein S12 methylthiotransferase
LPPAAAPGSPARPMKTNPHRPDRRKINVVTLGCSKNLVDSEVLLAQLRAAGKTATHEAEQDDAGTVVINTCGFIDRAKEQSIQTIFHHLERKRRGQVERVIVTGCLSHRYRDELRAEMPEVDAFFGNHEDLPNLLRELGADYRKELVGERTPLDQGHYAYLKISEGCSRGCSFCAIPLMRGKHRSRELEFLVNEARFLVDKGVKEILLIAQDLSSYGLDLYGKKRLRELLEALADIPGLAWLRLHYAYPAGFPTNVLPVLAERANVCKYLDMPVQHISTPVLKRMRRAIDRERTEELLLRIRAEVPGITLRTTLLVGHPGETEEDHAQLLDFLTRHRIERVGVFPYSHEENTHSHTFADDVPAAVKQRRFDEVMQLQQSISREINQAKLGQTLRVLVDRKEGRTWRGRTEGDSPEVDNEVLLKGRDLAPGRFVQARITQAFEYDLVGEVIPPAETR